MNERKAVWLENASGDICCNDRVDNMEMIGDKSHPPYFVIRVDNKQSYIGDIRRLRKLHRLLGEAISILESK